MKQVRNRATRSSSRSTNVGGLDDPPARRSARSRLGTYLRAVAFAAACCIVTGSTAVAQSSVRPAVQYQGPVEGYPGTFAVWVYFDFPVSVECSPPRACYAKTQWVYAHVNCYVRSAAALQTISMDLNGDVVAVSNWNDPEQLEYNPHLVRSGMSLAADRVLHALCGPYERD